MQKRHHSLNEYDFDDDDDARAGCRRGTGGGDRRSLVESSYLHGPRGTTCVGGVDLVGRDDDGGGYRNVVVQLDATTRRGGGGGRSSFEANPPPPKRDLYHAKEDRGEGDDATANTDTDTTTTHVALALFAVLGMGTLFPYNAIVACSDYFESIYPEVSEGGGGSVAGRLATTSIVSLFLTTVLLLPLTTVTVDDDCDGHGGGGGASGGGISRHSSEASIHGIAMTEGSRDDYDEECDLHVVAGGGVVGPSRPPSIYQVTPESIGSQDGSSQIIHGGDIGGVGVMARGDDSNRGNDPTPRRFGDRRRSWARACSTIFSLLRGLRTDPTRRIALGYATVSSVLLTLAISSYRLPLTVTLALAFLIGAGDAVSQSQLYVYAASIDGRCTAAVAFGSAAAGLVVSLLRLTTKAVFDGEGGDDDDGIGMRRDGAAFFGASSLVLVGCMSALRVVVRTEGRIRGAFAWAGNGNDGGTGRRDRGGGVGIAVTASGCKGGGGGSDESTSFSSTSPPSNSPPRMASPSPSSPFGDEAFHLASSFSNDGDDARGGVSRGDSSTPFHEAPGEEKSRKTTNSSSEVELLPTNWNVAFRPSPREDLDRTGTGGGGRKIAAGDLHRLASEDEGATATTAPSASHVDSHDGDGTPPHRMTTTTGYYSALPRPPPVVDSFGMVWRLARALPLHTVYQETLAVSWRPTIATFFNSFVTLSLFPGTITSMRSSSVDEDGNDVGSSWLPVLLVFVYNLFDCVGRGSLACAAVADLVRRPLGRIVCDPHRGGEPDRAVMVGYELPRFTAVVGVPCVARVMFIPVVAMCVVPRHSPWITSNWARFAIVSSFALSNGYVNAACFVAGPTMTSHNRAHRDSSSLVLLLAGFAGLVAGGFFGMFLDGLLAATTT